MLGVVIGPVMCKTAHKHLLCYVVDLSCGVSSIWLLAQFIVARPGYSGGYLSGSIPIKPQMHS